MDKTSAIMKITSWSQKDGTLELFIQDYGVRTAVSYLVESCRARFGGYVKADMTPPYRPRSTKEHGQNRHIWGHIQQIAKKTGNEVQDVEDAVKMRAVKRGYPMRENPLTGEMKPVSMATINTLEASYLIEELHQLGAEYGVNLIED